MSQVVLKQARHSSKQAILVLYGSYFAVLHGNASDATSAAAGAAASGTTEPLPVLKLVDYAEVISDDRNSRHSKTVVPVGQSAEECLLQLTALPNALSFHNSSLWHPPPPTHLCGIAPWIPCWLC